MKTLTDISRNLRTSLTRQQLTQADLKTRAGISQRTLTNVLSGQEDFKVSTLMAVADRLGLELLLVPKGAAGAFEGADGNAPPIRSRVEAALERARSTKADDGR